MAKSKTSTSSSGWPEITPEWRDTLMGIPSFDPFREAHGYQFKAELAEARIRFFEKYLVLPRGQRGTPPFVLLPWQKAIVGNLFGWVDAAGYRRFREMILLIPRKNGKTSFTSGLLLSCLTMDGERGAEIFSVAADIVQGSQAFQIACAMIAANQTLQGKLKIYTSAQAITWQEAGSSFKVLSSVPTTKHGLDIHACLIDELHTQEDRQMLDIIRTGMSARRQPLLILATTADFAGRQSICNERMAYARNVRDGRVSDPQLLPVLFEIPEDVAKQDPEWWQKRQYWHLANPSLGQAKLLSYMEQECRRAQNEPSSLPAFLQLDLNFPVKQVFTWLEPSQWAACGGVVDADALAGEPCFAGLDLASVRDLTVLVLYFPGADHQVLCHAWTTQEQLQRRLQRGLPEFAQWADAGILEVHHEPHIQIERVRERILELHASYPIRHLCIDEWNARQLAEQLTAEGVESTLHKQTFQVMNDPTVQTERLVAEGKLRHGSNPLLDWCATNTAIARKNEGIRPVKGGTVDDKIDAVVALILAVYAAMGYQEDAAASVYETRGILTI